jgi:uncharacterized FAD-dependent dehydrogenase
MVRKKKIIEEISEASQEDAKKADAEEKAKSVVVPVVGQETFKEFQKPDKRVVDMCEKLANHLGCRVEIETVVFDEGREYEYEFVVKDKVKLKRPPILWGGFTVKYI